MKNATQAKQTELSAAQEMMAAGREQITELEQDLRRLDSAMEQARAELTTLDHDEAYAIGYLAARRLDVSEVEQEGMTASGYAHLAQKTLNEKTAVKAAAEAKQKLLTAQAELATLETEHQERSTQIWTRRGELEKSLHLLIAEKEVTEEQRAMVAAGYQKALDVCGDLVYAELLAGFEGKRERVEVARAALLNEQIALHEYHTTALIALKEWPEKKRAMAALEPVDDSTSRIITQTIAYAETLIRDAKSVNAGFPYSVGYDGFWVLLTIPPQQLTDYHSELRERQLRMKRLLSQYEEYCASL